MSSNAARSEEPPKASETHLSRLQMLTDLLVFQFKLALDGLRDLLLSPLAIIAAAIGLVAGGDQPDRYLQRVIRFGRRTEVWINLFGEHDGPGTADDLVNPLRSRVIGEAQANPWIRKAGAHLNRQLDEMNSALAAGNPSAEGPQNAHAADPVATTPESSVLRPDESHRSSST